MKKVIILFISLACFYSSFGQDKPTEETNYKVYHLEDGETYTGVELSKTDSTVTIQLQNESTLIIPSKKIKRVQSAVIRKGKAYFPNPNSTRYFYGPSGYGLKKGEGYYQNTYLFLNSVSYGFTDYFTVGGGVEFISLSQGTPIFFLTPKFSFPISEKFSAGAGVLYLNVSAVSDEDYSLGIAYGVGTYGSKEHNFTVGAGYGFVGDDLANRPIITFSGMTRIGKKFALVSENWGAPYESRTYTDQGEYTIDHKYEMIFSLGLRYMTPRLTIDFALVGNDDIFEELMFGIPYLDVVIPFGNK